jgi:uncharacterized membrane protein
MKIKFSVTVFLVIFAVSSFTLRAKEPATTNDEGIPENIQAIIKKSCFGCHNSDSKNEDAKEDLDFKKLEDLSKIKKISAYKNIAETVEEEKMPPKKFLDRYPDKKLTDEEKKALIEWAKKEAMALVKSN